MVNGKPAALVLSGGGALGAAHLGVAQVLQERGFRFDFLAGVSAGSIVAAGLACGRSAKELTDVVSQIRLFSLAFDFSKTGIGLIRGSKIEQLLDEVYGGCSFADLSVPLFIGATDFMSGERVVISSGRIADAVRSSLSVPILFEPYFHRGLERWLVDGGLTQNFPVDVATSNYRGEVIFGVDVCSSLHGPIDLETSRVWHALRNFTAIGQRTLRIMFQSQQSALPPESRLIRILPDVSEFSAFDAHKVPELIQAGADATDAVLQGLVI